MNARVMYVIGPLLALLLAAGGVWWWSVNMEKHWEAQSGVSEEALKNPMLAASRLLTQHHHPVQIEDTLSTVLLKPAIPKGTLILAANTGVMTTPQVNRLLSWVARGNTLILSPMWRRTADKNDDSDGDDDETDEDRANTVKSNAKYRPDAGVNDQLGLRFGVALSGPVDAKELCRRPTITQEWMDKQVARGFTYIDCVAKVTLPDGTYPLQLDVSQSRLVLRGAEKPMLYYDDDGKALRVYEHGKGRVVFIAQNYFDNYQLADFDHAELLLGLVEQNTEANSVLIVKRPDVPKWYDALWAMVPQTLVALAVGLLLLGWMAVRRFGPLLPEPDLVRRSVLEHVEASSRWLWKSGKGREILLGAARAVTQKILLRRAPELHKLNEQERVAYLAEHTGLLRSDVDSALHYVAASRPPEFTRQIQTLQRLRKYYER